MARFKEIELSKMRLEESRKYREQMDQWIQEYEKKYLERLDKLKQREEEVSKLWERKERVTWITFEAYLFS